MFASHLGGLRLTGEIHLSDHSVAGSTSLPTQARARYQLLATGYAQESINSGAFTNIEQYCTGTPSNYQVRATLISGTIGLGTFDTWTTLSSDQLYRNIQSTGGTTTGTFRLDIRHIATGVIQDSALITLEATAA